MLMPAFRRHSAEATILGRLLTGYGEIDFSFAHCAAWLSDDPLTIMRAIFRMRTESGRITLADTLIAPRVTAYKELAGRYTYALGCVRRCLAIRNQYAHCHWNDDDNAGLFFTNLEDAASKAVGFDFAWLHVDVSLLEQQEEFFAHTRRCLWHVQSEYLFLANKKKHAHPHAMPKRIPPVSMHNPPEQHPAPWPALMPSTPPK